MKKRFKKQSDLIKRAVANTPMLSPQEMLCRNVLRLNGIKNPTLEKVQYVIRQQQVNETNKKYKELTK